MSRQRPVSERILLSCRIQGCGWDYASTGWYVTYNRYGYRRWERVAKCLRGCTSTQRQWQEPWLGGRRLGSKLWHPPEWYELKGFYWAEANEESQRRQLEDIGGVENLEVIIPIGFKGEKADPKRQKRDQTA